MMLKICSTRGHGLKSSGPSSSAAEEGRGEVVTVVSSEDEPLIYLSSNAPASNRIKCLFVIWWSRKIMKCFSLEQPLLNGNCMNQNYKQDPATPASK
ncbi:hypothetical protein Nepgr_021819 [Nepenthes gracilis]|uniref:Uncharacterized protein n=1 Tax=Nepenthes gracilis TaxID=150966 RepID=A0AAD3XWE3_NEPGR|nr:hypothetical protein Nepgr_021819 [Nepenthes gracilis]